MTKQEKAPGFAPSDITDSRKLLEWQTRYPPEAWKEIRFEAIYLACCFISTPPLMLLFFCHFPQFLWKTLDPSLQIVIARFAIAWISGMLGGTLFALKWLYHVVAHGFWNYDRRLWRLFTPHISGGLAFAFVALVSSGVVTILNAGTMSKGTIVVGLAFLVGYFSDSAVAKLTEISDTLFGVSYPKKNHVPELAQGSNSRADKPEKQDTPTAPLDQLP